MTYQKIIFASSLRLKRVLKIREKNAPEIWKEEGVRGGRGRERGRRRGRGGRERGRERGKERGRERGRERERERGGGGGRELAPLFLVPDSIQD